jgi:RimJ/RimL family protein N-acetyltransferase
MAAQGPRRDRARLSDGVVSLRHFTVQDVGEHLAGEDDEQVRWVSGGVGTVDTVTRMVERARESWANGGPRLTFALEDPTGALIGFVEANTDHEGFVGHEPGDANVSYGLYAPARGKGYASRGVTLMEGFLRERGVRRAAIRVEPANVRSLAVPRRLGYVERGRVQDPDGTTHVLFFKELSAGGDRPTSA